MLQSCSSQEFKRESLHKALYFPKVSSPSPCKFQSFHSPLNSTSFRSLNSYNFHKLQRIHDSQSVKSVPLFSETARISSRVYLGFKLQCNSGTGVLLLPTRSESNYSKKKKYGGLLPKILRSLETDDDVEKTLNLHLGKMSAKEQTVILKEQRSWERVVRVFEWIKSQPEYSPNVIHYNVVLRVLGHARKWDELRLCWIEMAKKGVLPTNNTYGMLVDVYGKAGLVKEALLWIKHMKLRGIFPDEVTMNTVVRVLKDGREYDRADRFYKNWCVGKIELDDLELDSMEDSESGSCLEPVSLKHFLLTELFRTGGKNPPSNVVAPSCDSEGSIRKPRLTATYNTLIDLYGKAGRLNDAGEVFAEMLKSGIAVDTVTFNTMIFTCGSHGHLLEAESLVSKMEEMGISPDTKTYNILFSLYAEVGNIDKALQCYRKIREVGLFPDVVTHRAVLQILCERRMVHEVEIVIEEMEKGGKSIDNQSLPVIVKMFVNEGLTERAKSLFESCQLNSCLPSKTYAAVIDAYAEKGLWAEAEAVFYCKRDLVAQKKDVVEYNVMIKAYGTAKLYDKAFLLFKGMKNHGIWPDECTYRTLVQMFSGGDLVDQARDLLCEMQEVGFKPNCLTFSAMIASYARLGKLSDAVDVYQEMLEAGTKPNEIVFGSLINGFAESGNIEEALRYFGIMEEFGISANQIVLTSLIKAYSKAGSMEGARKLYEKLKHLEGGPDIVASNSMLSLFADVGMVSEARSIFHDLKEKCRADGVSYATMMYLYKNMGMIDEAIEVAEEMKDSGLLRDCSSFNKAMACYATGGHLLECGKLLQEMITRKLLPNGGTFKVLFTVLKKGNIPVETIKQLETAYQEGKPYARQAVITSVFSVVGLHVLALESCETFVQAGSVLDTFAYNVAIYVYGAAGKIDKALKLFMSMKDGEIEPDVVTYINLVGCYGKAGMVEGVKRIYSQLKYGDIDPNESLFNAVIEAYQSVNRQDLAELVNQEMRFAFETEPSSDHVSENEDESDETSVHL